MSLNLAFSPHLLDASDARLNALDYVTDAFAEAVLDGVDVEMIAEAAISTALRELVAAYGEERVAGLMGQFPERVREGEFSSRVRQ